MRRENNYVLFESENDRSHVLKRSKAYVRKKTVEQK